MESYEERLVDLYQEVVGDSGVLKVSTVRVSDGDKPFETGIAHPDYNNGDWVIVEAYDSRYFAEEGHNRWVRTMTNKPLPRVLEDCGNSTISWILGLVGGVMAYERRVAE